MDEEKIKEYIQANLTIEIKEFAEYGGKGFEVILKLKNEKISTDRLYTKYWQD